MALAGYCSGCGGNVWLTGDGRCAAGHGSECISNVYDASAPVETTVTAAVAVPQVAAVPLAKAPWPSSAKVLVGVLCGLMVVGGLALAFVALRPQLAGSGAGLGRGPTPAQTTSSSTVELETTASNPSATSAVDSNPPSQVPAVSSGQPSLTLHTPKFGGAERVAILDALRVPVQKDIGQRVVFRVSWMKSEGGFAFIDGEPLQPSGRSIDYRTTKFATAVRDGVFGGGVDALLRWRDGRWEIVDYDLGATDVVWEPWEAQYGAPHGIFPSLGD